MSAKRELILSLTKKDFKIETFRAGGKGGQNQNKLESGVRIIHEKSGARAESREFRDQFSNKKAAFKRLCESTKFKLWHKIEVAKIIARKDKNIKILSDEEIMDKVEKMIENDLKNNKILIEEL